MTTIPDPTVAGETGDVPEGGVRTDARRDPAADVANLVRAIAGVGAIYAARPALVAAATTAVLSVVGASRPSPVTLSVGASSVRLAVEIGVESSTPAPEVARRVGEALRAWCAREHPSLTPSIDVRVSSIA